MKVIQARLRGLGPIMVSRWFNLSPRLNLLHYPDDSGRTSFLRTLATINPPSSCRESRLFADLPPFIKQQGYLRKIHPEKRTVALATFSTTPALVKDLAAVSPHLYETDRIEVGRRLDYSRWINFVEIPSSTRWSEIAADMQRLMDLAEKIAPEKTEHLADIITSLHGSDRIKDGLDRILSDWLRSLPTTITENSRQLCENLLNGVLRADHFHSARRIVEQRLPLFMVLETTPGSSLTTLQAATLSAIAFSRSTCRTEPVLLFDSPERFLPETLQLQLADFILGIAESCQCLYAYAAVDIFPEDQDITRYTSSGLTGPGH